jgi:hypothetical protein
LQVGGKKSKEEYASCILSFKKIIHQEIDWKRFLKTYLPRFEDVLNLGQFAKLQGCLLLYHFNMTNFHQFNSQALAR